MGNDSRIMVYYASIKLKGVNIMHKRKLEELIFFTLDLAQQSRTSGLLALEEVIKTITNIHFDNAPMIVTLLQLIVDGTDTENIRRIGENFYITKRRRFVLNKTYHNLYDNIILEGMLAIHQGDNPAIIKLYLFSMLPDRWVSPENSVAYYTTDSEYKRSYNNFESLPQNEFSQLYWASDRDIQIMMRDIDSTTLAKMISITPQDLCNVFLANMSHRAAEMLCSDAENIVDHSDSTSLQLNGEKAIATIISVAKHYGVFDHIKDMRGNNA